MVYRANEGLFGLEGFRRRCWKIRAGVAIINTFHKQERPTWGRRPISGSRPFRHRHICSFLPYSNAETKCARFLGPLGSRARKPCTFAPSFPAQQREGQMCRRGGHPQLGPDTNQKRFLFRKKEFITQNLALIFQNLPAPSSSLHRMNGRTKCAWLLSSTGSSCGLDFPKIACSLLLPAPLCLVLGLAPGPTGTKTGHICWLSFRVQGCGVYLGLIVEGLGSKVSGLRL